MIFYFSGTGNSLYAAQMIANMQKQQIISIPRAIKSNSYTYVVKENETIGFCYPVHGWQPPSMVIEFIKKLELVNYEEQYIYSLLTCGGTWEYTCEILDKALNKKGWRLSGDYKLKMPHNYIISQDLNSPEYTKEKLETAKEQLRHYNEQIKDQVQNYHKEKHSYVKSYMVGGMFKHLGKSEKPFFTTDACRGCGLCVSVCPAQIIELKDRKPVWYSGCQQCMGCINRCPQKAIQYGKQTEKRGRYINPYCRFEDE